MEYRLYPELKKLVHKYMGIDKIIDNIVNKKISGWDSGRWLSSRATGGVEQRGV